MHVSSRNGAIQSISRPSPKSPIFRSDRGSPPPPRRAAAFRSPWRLRRATAAAPDAARGGCCSSRSSCSTRWPSTSSPAASSSPAPSSTYTATGTTAPASPLDARPGPRPPLTASSSLSSTPSGHLGSLSQFPEPPPLLRVSNPFLIASTLGPGWSTLQGIS